MSFFEFPNTRTYDTDLGWLIAAVKALKEAMETFVATETLKFADPIIWNITTQYQKSTIVLDTEGNAYLSKQAVPSGIQLNNSDYWLEIFNFTEYTRTANQNLTINTETNTTRATAPYQVDDWLIWNDVLYKVTSPIAIDDALIVAPAAGSNIIHFTVEDFIKAFITYATGLIQQYKTDIDASELAYRQQLANDITNTTTSLQNQLNAVIAGATVDSEVIAARVGINSYTYASLHDAIVGQIGDTRFIDELRNPIPRFIEPHNKNYAFSADFTLIDSFFDTNGTIVAATNYKGAYVVIPFASTFLTLRKYGTFTTKQNRLPLFDENKAFVKTLYGTVIDTNIVEFTISESDFKTCVYVGLSVGPNTALPMWLHSPTYPANLKFEEPQMIFTSTKYLEFDSPSATTLNDVINNAIEKSAENVPVVAGSANILMYDKYNWSDGYITPSSNALVSDSDFEHAYIPIFGPGNYTNITDQNNLGQNAYRVPFYDINKNYLGYVTGTVDANNNRKVDYTISDSNAQYIVFNRKKTGCVPKLFVNRQSLVDGSGINHPINNNWIFEDDPLYKSIMCFLGDSICAASTDSPMARGGYAGRFNLEYQANTSNYGVGGATITADTYYNDSTPRHWICRDIATVYSDHPDANYIVLEGGTNDADVLGRWNGNTPPSRWGTWSDNNFSGSYDDTTFCGAVEQLIFDAISNFPKAKIVFIIPMEMGYNNSNTINNRKRYFDEIIAICKKWHVPVINAWDELGVDARLIQFYDPDMTPTDNVNAKHFYRDGQHPTSYGYNRLFNLIKNQIHNY